MISSWSSFSPATSFVSSFLGSAIASPIVGPLTRAMTGPSCSPLVRSHSQALSRGGRPKVVRKPLGSSTPESDSSAARVPGATPGNFETAPSTREDRVVEHLGRQPAGDRVRVVRLVVLVPLVRLDRELVRPRLADQRDHVADVEAALEELLGQVVEQLGVGGRVPRADVVDRLHDPDAEQVAPEPVDVAPGEVRVVPRGDPGRQLLAAGGLLVGLVVARERELGRRHLPGPLVLDLAARDVGDDLVERLPLFDGRGAKLLALACGIGLEPDLGEEGRGLVILVLRPALEGMVVALVAVEPDRHEQVRRVLHRLGGIAEDLEVRRRRVLAVRAAGRQDRAGELVVGRVPGHLIADPLAIGDGSFDAQELAVHVEQVGPLVGPVLDVLLAADQAVDQLLALGAGVAGVGQEGLERPPPRGEGRSGRGRRGG